MGENSFIDSGSSLLLGVLLFLGSLLEGNFEVSSQERSKSWISYFELLLEGVLDSLMLFVGSEVKSTL